MASLNWWHAWRRRRFVHRLQRKLTRLGIHVSEEQIETKMALTSIRENLEFFGIPCSDRSDEELTASIERIGELLSSFGLTVEQFSAVGELFAGERVPKKPLDK